MAKNIFNTQNLYEVESNELESLKAKNFDYLVQKAVKNYHASHSGSRQAKNGDVIIEYSKDNKKTVFHPKYDGFEDVMHTLFLSLLLGAVLLMVRIWWLPVVVLGLLLVALVHIPLKECREDAVTGSWKFLIIPTLIITVTLYGFGSWAISNAQYQRMLHDTNYPKTEQYAEYRWAVNAHKNVPHALYSFRKKPEERYEITYEKKGDTYRFTKELIK